MQTAFVFPGQASQYVGMGMDLWEKSHEVRDIFATASDICGLNIEKICFEGPIEVLNETINLQPALATVEISMFFALRHIGIEPDVLAGHSLGEYPALYAANVLSLEDTFRIVKERARLMHEASEKYPGGMLAILRLDIEKVREILRDYSAELANYNSPKQIVVSGRLEELEEIKKRVNTVGGKGIILNVSGPWHSSFMKEAKRAFSDFLEGIEFRPPRIPIFFNVTASVENEPEKIKTLMCQQLCSPVLWCEEVKNMYTQGVKRFIEVGPKKVLCGLIERILPDARVYPGEEIILNRFKRNNKLTAS